MYANKLKIKKYVNKLKVELSGCYRTKFNSKAFVIHILTAIVIKTNSVRIGKAMLYN